MSRMRTFHQFRSVLGVCAIVCCVTSVTVVAGLVPAASAQVSDLPTPTLVTPGDFAAPTVRTASASGNAAAASSGQQTSRPALPGVGPEMMRQLPADSTQVLVAIGSDSSSTTAALALFEFRDNAWQEVRTFAAHNGENGWLADRAEGDKTSPVGVFGITDAGGYLKDPGTSLTYKQQKDYRTSAVQVYGADYTNVFDYVIAINYNRVPGTPPSDNERPMGWDKGGKIWLHVDHNKPTRGCVTITREEMKYLLTTLDTDRNPHIIMGDEASVSA